MYRSMGFSIREEYKSKYHIPWKREMRSCLICSKYFSPKKSDHWVHRECKCRYNYFTTVVQRNIQKYAQNPFHSARDIGFIESSMKRIYIES